MADFGTVTITMIRGQKLLDALRDALKSRGQADQMDSKNGIFIINDLTFLKIQKGEKITCLVEYEYGG